MQPSPTPKVTTWYRTINVPEGSNSFRASLNWLHLDPQSPFRDAGSPFCRSPELLADHRRVVNRMTALGLKSIQDLGRWFLEQGGHPFPEAISIKRLAELLEIEPIELDLSTTTTPPTGREQERPSDPLEPVTDDIAEEVVEILLADGFYSASGLAGMLSQRSGHISITSVAVESFLRRYRDTYPDCCREVEGRRKNEARILYRYADVWPALKDHFRLT